MCISCCVGVGAGVGVGVGQHLNRAAHLAHLDGYLEVYEYLLVGATPTWTPDDICIACCLRHVPHTVYHTSYTPLPSPPPPPSPSPAAPTRPSVRRSGLVVSCTTNRIPYAVHAPPLPTPSPSPSPVAPTPPSSPRTMTPTWTRGPRRRSRWRRTTHGSGLRCRWVVACILVGCLLNSCVRRWRRTTHGSGPRCRWVVCGTFVCG